jgi:hypothetical protein
MMSSNESAVMKNGILDDISIEPMNNKQPYLLGFVEKRNAGHRRLNKWVILASVIALVALAIIVAVIMVTLLQSESK